MNIKILFQLLLVVFLMAACGTNNKLTNIKSVKQPLNVAGQQLLDSILRRGLDYEALYTIIGKIKPMSSVASFSFPIANADSLKKTKEEVLDLTQKQKYLAKIEQLQSLFNRLNYPDLKFVFVPYAQSYKDKRTMQLSVVRVSLMDSILRAKASFFGQFGLVPGTDPAVVISTVEGSNRYERLRAYGYLFGYPDYAIDFFVDAFVVNDQTKKHVDRNFFQIPAYSTPKGAFVYAYPKDHTPDKTDSILYLRAQSVLANYKEIRKDYLNQDSTLQSQKLLDDFFYRRK